jgi:hypothetical protein
MLIIILTEFVCEIWNPRSHSRHETHTSDTNSHSSSEKITDLYETRSSTTFIITVRVTVSILSGLNQYKYSQLISKQLILIIFFHQLPFL